MENKGVKIEKLHKYNEKAAFVSSRLEGFYQYQKHSLYSEIVPQKKIKKFKYRKTLPRALPNTFLGFRKT